MKEVNQVDCNNLKDIFEDMLEKLDLFGKKFELQIKKINTKIIETNS